MTKALEADYVVSQRSARDRFNLLCKKHKAKQRNELKAAEISLEITELDKTLNDLIECVAESNVSHEKATEGKKTMMKKRETLERK